MVWFFEREDETLRISTTYESVSGVYALTMHRQDGTDTTESFPTKAAFHKRLQEIERGLLTDSWSAAGWSLLPRLRSELN
jgi:hypothetical protein